MCFGSSNQIQSSNTYMFKSFEQQQKTRFSICFEKIQKNCSFTKIILLYFLVIKYNYFFYITELMYQLIKQKNKVI